MSHLGSLDVPHVIPQQLCEFQLLVRSNPPLHLLQEHQQGYKVFTDSTQIFAEVSHFVATRWAYPELFKQVRQLLQLPDNEQN